MQQGELAAAQLIFSTYSSPCLSVKTVYNYVLWAQTPWQVYQQLIFPPLATDILCIEPLERAEKTNGRMVGTKGTLGLNTGNRRLWCVEFPGGGGRRGEGEYLFSLAKQSEEEASKDVENKTKKSKSSELWDRIPPLPLMHGQNQFWSHSIHWAKQKRRFYNKNVKYFYNFLCFFGEMEKCKALYSVNCILVSIFQVVQIQYVVLALIKPVHVS